MYIIVEVATFKMYIIVEVEGYFQNVYNSRSRRATFKMYIIVEVEGLLSKCI